MDARFADTEHQMARNYYEVLGVPKTADAKEITSAFRRLARKYHPDVNPNDKTAEAKFKEINEAQEVLTDPERRKQYDKYGDDWKHAEQIEKARAAGAYPPPGGTPFGGNPNYARTYRSGQPAGDFRVDYGAAESGEFGSVFDSLFGRRQNTAQAAPADVEYPVEITLEEAASGATRVLQLQEPNGKSRKLEVQIPAGTHTGSRIRMAGAGTVGARGRPASDLYLVVQVAAHPLFTVEGDDLHTEIPVPLTTAVLGGEVEVPTLKGRVALQVPPETQNGKVFRLGKLGMPKLNSSDRGDLYAKVRVVLPTGLTEAQRQVFRDLQKAGK